MRDEAETITLRPDEGGGYVHLWEFKENIWVLDINADKRGEGNKLMKCLIDYAKKRGGKTLYGNVNAQRAGMSNERLKKWYEFYGCRPTYMASNENAITLRT